MENINNKLMLSRQKLTSLPFRKIAPNIVTMLALCAGVTYPVFNTGRLG